MMVTRGNAFGLMVADWQDLGLINLTVTGKHRSPQL